MKIIGTLSVTNKGFGFVTPISKKYQKDIEDIFIPKRYIFDAIDKDIVEVRILAVKEKGPEGTIEKVIKRTKANFIGSIIGKTKKHYKILISIPPKEKIAILKTEKKLKKGDRVEVKIKSFKSPSYATFIKCFGNIKDPSIDNIIALKEFDIKDKFPKKIKKELKKEISKKDLTGRKNFLDLTCITIDPKNAKDFDDAVSCIKDEKGNFHLGVHIADVSHFVKQNSICDKEAYQRANSTYFPGFMAPMLPKELSNDLCSLKENQIRLTVSVMMDFDKNGNLYHQTIERSYIKSKKRLTYKEASSILQSKKSDLFHILQDMQNLCSLLKKKRLERGSIDFSLPEAILEIDEKGSPQNIRLEPYDISHQMIEEFMLKANETVAKHLHAKDKILIYRIHERPSLKAFEEFYDFAKMLGFKLPKKPDHKDIQNLFLKAKNTRFFHKLSTNFIQSMKTAFYSEENIGHYGLSLEHYCHFTSPIRRYTDLVIHRLLLGDKIDFEELKKISVHCSKKERNSFKAEISVIDLKKIRLLKKWFKKDKKRKYKAIITKIKPYFIYFEIQELLLEGYIHISDISDDYYIYYPSSMSFRGEYSHKIFKYGNIIEIKVKNIDLIRQKVEWQI